jgi:hypothetical protein
MIEIFNPNSYESPYQEYFRANPLILRIFKDILFLFIEMVHWIYVLECEDYYIYVGETTRLFRRFNELK